MQKQEDLERLLLHNMGPMKPLEIATLLKAIADLNASTESNEFSEYAHDILKMVLDKKDD